MKNQKVVKSITPSIRVTKPLVIRLGECVSCGTQYKIGIKYYNGDRLIKRVPGLCAGCSDGNIYRPSLPFICVNN